MAFAVSTKLYEAPLAEHKKGWKPLEKEITSPLLRRYSRMVSSAASGALYKQETHTNK